jgi:dCTP deaminase
MVHATAGFIDCGFRGNITLEIKNITQNCAIRLVQGRRIAQISFERVEGCDMRYAGKYQGQDAVTGSRINQDSEVQK